MERTVTTHLRARLLAKAGIPLEDDPVPNLMTFDEIKEQLPTEAFQLAFNRLCMGQLRYGAPKTKGSISIAYLKKRIDQSVKRFEQTGNLEDMIDLINWGYLGYYCVEINNRNWNPEDRED